MEGAVQHLHRHGADVHGRLLHPPGSLQVLPRGPGCAVMCGGAERMHTFELFWQGWLGVDHTGAQLHTATAPCAHNWHTWPLYVLPWSTHQQREQVKTSLNSMGEPTQAPCKHQAGATACHATASGWHYQPMHPLYHISLHPRHTTCTASALYCNCTV